MVSLVVTPEQLSDPEAWPPESPVYDRTREAFLSVDQARELSRGIGKYHLHQLVFRPLVEVVPGLLFEGYNIISAPPKIGKTIIAHQLMMAVDMGRDWLGHPVRQGPVLFFGLEDTLASVMARDVRLAGDWLAEYVGGGAGRLTVTDCGDTAAERQQHLATLLQEGYGPQHEPYALVVVDTSPRFLGSGDSAMNAYERGLALTAPLDRFGLRYHCAILGIHHDRKGDAGDDFDAVSGGLSITGTAQCVMSLRRTRGGSTGVLNIYPRAAEEQKLALEFEAGAWQLSPSVAVEVAEEAAGCRRAVVAYLMTQTTGDTLGGIVTSEQCRAYSYANVRQALQRLKDNGKVQIEASMWSVVRAPAPVSDALRIDRSRGPLWTATEDGCDRCGAKPARLHNRNGSKWCRTHGYAAVWAEEGQAPVDVAAPAAAPAAQPNVPPAPVVQAPPAPVPLPRPAHGGYKRPSWCPAELGTNAKGTGPISVWITLLEASFANKNVELIAHPYPGDTIPPPFKKLSKSRGLLLHPGSHGAWRSDAVEPGSPVQAIDRHGSFLGSLGIAEIPIGRCIEHTGRGPIKGHAGAHLLDRWPEYGVTHLPHPGGRRPREKEIWVATSTLILMEQQVSAGTLEPFEVLRSWTGSTTRLEQLQAELRDARDAAIEQGDVEFQGFLKSIYSIGLSTMGESGSNTRFWRPEWPPLVRAVFHANMWRAAKRATEEAGLQVAGLRRTDALHVVGDPFALCQMARCEVHPLGWKGSGFFTHGQGLGHWGLVGEPYEWGSAADHEVWSDGG